MYKCQVGEFICYTKAYQTNYMRFFLFSKDNESECVLFFIYRALRVTELYTF